MKTPFFIDGIFKNRMVVERERERENNFLFSLLIQKRSIMKVILLILIELLPVWLFSQIPVSKNVSNATVILLNMDSIFSQSTTYGWLKFYSGNAVSVNNQVLNIKAALIPTNSRIVMYDTVMLQIVNIYDNTFHLIAGDTLKGNDSLIVNTTSVAPNQWYYIQTIANYPCDTCDYGRNDVQFKLGVQENPPGILCKLPACAFSGVIGIPGTTCPYPCVEAGQLGNYSGPCVYNNCGVSCAVSATSTPNSIDFCDDNIPDSPVYINFLQSIHTSTIVHKDAMSVCNPENIYLAPLVHCAGSWKIYCTVPGFTTVYNGSVVPAVYVNLYNTSNGTVQNYSVSSWPFHLPANALQAGVLYLVDYTWIFNYPNSGCSFTQVQHHTSCCQYYIQLVLPPSVNVVSTSCAPTSTSNGTVCVHYYFPMTLTDVAHGGAPIFSNFCGDSSCNVIGPNDYQWSFSGNIISSTGVTTSVYVGVNDLLGHNNYNDTSIVQMCYTLPVGNYTLNVQFNMPHSCYCNFPQQFVQTFSIGDCCINSKAGNITINSATLVPAGTSGAIIMAPGGGPYSGLVAAPVSANFNNMVFTIQQKLDVATPVNFNKCDILFSDNAEMNIINPSINQIVINQSYLHSCMIWRSIKHTNNTALIIQNSVIEDAAVAIDVNGLPNANLTIKNTVFNKNHFSIRVIGSLTNIFSVQNSIFTSRNINPALYNAVLASSLPNPPSFNTLLSPTFLSSRPPGLMNTSFAFSGYTGKRSETGILILNSKSKTNSLNINGNALTPIIIGIQRNIPPPGNTANFENTTTNLFDYLNQGILVTFGGQAEIVNNQFQNIFTTSNSYLPPSKGAIFTLFGGTAIVGKNPTGNPNAIRFANIFRNNLYGIHLSFPGSAGVGACYNNHFISNTNGIFVETWNAAINNKKVDISNNTAQNNTYFTNVFNSQQINMEFGNNRLLNGNYGLYINDVLSTSNLSYFIHDNRFESLYFGVYANNTQNILATQNNFTLQAAPPNLTPPFPFQSAVAFVNVQNSDVNNNWIQGANPAHSLNSNLIGIYLENATHNKIYCNTIRQLGSCVGVNASCMPTMLYSNDLGSNTFPLARYGIRGINISSINNLFGPIWGPGSAAGSTYANGNTWGWLANQYANLAISNLSPVGTSVYYYPNTSSPDYPLNTFPLIPKFIANYPNLTQCNTPPPGIISSIVPVPFTVLPPNINIIASRQTYKYIRDNNIPITPNSVVQSIVQYESFFNTPRFYRNDSIVQKAMVQQQKGLITQRWYDNNNIFPQDTVELTQKQFNAIYYQFLKDTTLSSNNINQLQLLASLCPYRAGMAVYQARALLKKFDSTNYYNPCEAFYTSNNQRLTFSTSLPEDEGTSVQIKIYPNPLYGKEWYCESNTEGMLILSDLTGRTIQAVQIKKGKNTIVSKEWTESTYLVRMEKDGKTIWASLLIIQN